VLAKGHERRNQWEYGGWLEVDERLLAGVMAAARAILDALTEAVPPSQEP
jgi:hypothetical protein